MIDIHSLIETLGDGLFGIPHGILSSPDEWAAFGLGLGATAVGIVYDGEMDLAPITNAGVVAVVASLALSALSPSDVTDEWHVAVTTVVLSLGFVATFVRD